MSKAKTKTTLGEMTEIKKLKREILSGHEVVEGFVKSSKDKARQALAEALLVGKKLIRVKELLGFGSFRRWIETELKGKLSQATATRYIRLAEDYSHVSNQSPTSLRKAYILLGLIDEDAPQAPSVPAVAPKNQPPVISPKDETLPESAPPAPAPIEKIKPGVAAPTKAVGVPSASLASKLNIQPTKPDITLDDELSRAKFLVKELLLDIQIKIQTRRVSPEQAREAVLSPLEKFFAEQQSPSAEPSANPAGKAAKKRARPRK